jgi:hypothetical protein
MNGDGSKERITAVHAECLARAEVEKGLEKQLSDTEWLKHRRTLVEFVAMLARWEQQQIRANAGAVDPDKAA